MMLQFNSTPSIWMDRVNWYELNSKELFHILDIADKLINRLINKESVKVKRDFTKEYMECIINSYENYIS
jgi:hypothetical protein